VKSHLSQEASCSVLKSISLLLSLFEEDSNSIKCWIYRKVLLLSLASLCEITFECGSKLQRIGEYAFYRTDIKIIQIPSNVEFIGDHCSYECDSLCEITL
jgi:hypothetical protein